MTADLILVARVRTMDAGRPLADAVAITAERVVGLGSVEEVLALRGPRTEVRTLPGACILPGFHDAHVHLAMHGLSLDRLRLDHVATLPEALDAIAAEVAGRPPGTWVLGSGFSLPRWGCTTLHREALDRIAPDHPVYLRSQDHHAGWANGAALAAAGVSAQTPDPTSGVIVRDGSGEPTGYLLELAGALVDGAVPAPSEGDLERSLAAAGADLASYGITTVHHMSYESPRHWRAIATSASGSAFPLRVWACIPHADLEHAAAIGLAQGQGGDGFVVGGAKFFADGALGSRTAWMLEPYATGEGSGMSVDAPDVLAERYRLAAEAGFASVTHAIGDAAVRGVLDALEATADAWRPRGLRPRIEHVQHIHPDDVPRVAELGVTASMQPIHLTFDAPSIRGALGDRLDRAYRIADLQRTGAVLAFGSDTTVASPDVIEGLRAAVRRLDRTGEAFGPDQALDVATALAGWTTGAAYAIGREGRSGRLRVGFDADLVVIDHDPVDDLDSLEVLVCVQRGRVTYEA
ncbi:amidohydrolase [soil metagenome]